MMQTEGTEGNGGGVFGIHNLCYLRLFQFTRRGGRKPSSFLLFKSLIRWCEEECRGEVFTEGSEGSKDSWIRADRLYLRYLRFLL